MRLFIAIPVPPDIKRAVSDTAIRLQKKGATGRFVPENNYHVTLHFIGESDAFSDIADAIHESAKDVQPFLLRLSDYSYFPSNNGHTGFVKVLDETHELAHLYETLEQNLWDCGFSKNHSSLMPHITIGRNIINDADFSCPRREAFTADSIVLYESIRNKYGNMEYTPIHKEYFAK